MEVVIVKILQIAALEVTHTKLLKQLNTTCIEQQYDVHCACYTPQKPQNYFQDNMYFHNIYLPRHINVVTNFISLYKLIQLMKKLRPDVVHVHTPIAAVLGRIAAKIAKVPCIIYTAHGFYFHESMTNFKFQVYFNIEKWIGRWCTDYLFVQSKEDYYVAKQTRFLSKKHKNNYVHISNGIDLREEFNYHKMDVAAVSQLQSKLKITQSDIVITFIGRLVKEKGILELLSAFRQINDHRLKLIIIGDLHQSERDQMTIRQLEKYRNENNIIFTGLVHNVNHYLYLSDIFCLPSYREGMPRSILEAMAMKNAIIATDIRGCREEIIDGQHGYLVPTQSSDMIAQRINELITNPYKLKQFQDASYQRVNKKFNELDVVAKQLEIFKIIESSDTSC